MQSNVFFFRAKPSRGSRLRCRGLRLFALVGRQVADEGEDLGRLAGVGGAVLRDSIG